MQSDVTEDTGRERFREKSHSVSLSDEALGTFIQQKLFQVLTVCDKSIQGTGQIINIQIH